MLRFGRRLLTALLGGVAILAVGVGLGARLAPLADAEVLAIRSGSMSPAIGVGDLVVVERGRQPAAGEVAAFRLPSGTIVTHRVVRTAVLPDGNYVETRGDANASPDPVLVPADDVVGTVGVTLPLLGYVLALLSMPTGIVAIFATSASLALGVWLLEDPRPAERPTAHRRRPAAPNPLGFSSRDP